MAPRRDRSDSEIEAHTGVPNGSPASHDALSKTLLDTQQQPLSESSTHIIDPAKMRYLAVRPRHRYIFRRPRMIQYTHRDNLLTLGGEDTAGSHVVDSPVEKTESGSVEHSVSHHKDEVHEVIDRQRERLDLFIDLIWVGIIGNISEVFSAKAFGAQDPQTGTAILYFIIVFLPSWRIWNAMREFLNNFYMDDLLQRFFVFWIIVLTVFYGNNLAYVVEKPVYSKVVAISLYLLIRSSLFVNELVYCYFIPWLRWESFISFCIYLPSTGLWIAAIYLNEKRSVGPILAAIFLDYLVAIILDSPLRKKVLPGDHYKEIDPRHLTNRMANFFVIVLGEGVLQLVKDGPLGIGITRTASYSTWALTIYFLLAYVYFNGDSSHSYIPAVRHKGWRTIIWTFWHIPLFMCTLALSAGVMFIVRDVASQLDDVPTTETIPSDELPRYIHHAIWTVAGSLAGVIVSCTAIALLDEPVDEPGSLRITNRYLRLSARGVYCLVILLVPLHPNMNAEIFLGICSIMIVMLSIWEFTVSADKDWRWFEPKPKAQRIARAKKAEKKARLHPEQGTAALMMFPWVVNASQSGQNPHENQQEAKPTPG